MGVYAAIISSVIGTGIKLLGSAGGPSYPSAPQIQGLPVQKAKQFMQDYESRRMGVSVEAWKQRFPLLYQGGKYEISDIGRNQQGLLSPQVSGALQSAGLEQPKQGDQYKLATDLGLSPITLAQRNSQAVTRQIALNPEWTNKISGGTLATMIANNSKNQNAFSQFLGAQNTANYVTGQQRSAYNTAALTTGLLGATSIGVQAYQNSQNPLNRPFDPTAYPRSDVSNPGYYTPGYQSQGGGQGYYQPQQGGFGSQWGMTPAPYMNSGDWNSGDFGASGVPPSPSYTTPPTDLYNSFTPPPQPPPFNFG